MTQTIEQPSMEWDIRVPIFRNRLIRRQLGLAIGLPFGILALVLILVTKEGQWRYTLYALGFIGLLLVLTALLLLIVYGGKFHLVFFLNEKGISSGWHPDQRKRNHLINTLAFWGGLASGKPTVAGAGALAESRQETFIKWKSVRKINCDPTHFTVYVKGGFGESAAVFCTPENFSAAAAYIRNRIPHN